MKKCMVPGCKKPHLFNIGHSTKCQEHQNRCGHCFVNEANGSWKMGYCEECQPLLVSVTITLPLGIDDGKLSGEEFLLILEDVDANAV